MEWNGQAVTPRRVGLSIEPTDGTGRDLVLKLGTASNHCELWPDIRIFDEWDAPSVRVSMMGRWLAHLERLRASGGGVVMLPYGFYDQCTSWLRVSSPDGVDAEVQAGWSDLTEFEFDVEAFAGRGMAVDDFDPVRNAVIDRPLVVLIHVLRLLRDELALTGHEEPTCRAASAGSG